MSSIYNSILYAGYQYDEETGLYYLNARMYDPVTARFLQEDTYTGDPEDPLSLNRYTYCANNPIIYNDPSGHKIMYLDDEGGDIEKDELAKAKATVHNIKKKASKSRITPAPDAASRKSKKEKANTDKASAIAVQPGITGTEATTGAEAAELIIGRAAAHPVAVVIVITAGITYFWPAKTVNVGEDEAIAQYKAEEQRKNEEKAGETSSSENEVTGKDKGENKTKDGNESNVTQGKSRAPKEGDPDSIYEQVDDNGNIKSKTKYGDNRKPEYRQDYTHEHYSKEEGEYLQPHQHNYTYNANGQPTGETVTRIK